MVDTPRKVNDSLGYFRPAQEIDKVRTIPESNGMTGFVIPQLARITFRVCSDSFSSNGVREFLDDTNGYFKKFKDDNKGTAIYIMKKNDNWGSLF